MQTYKIKDMEVFFSVILYLLLDRNSVLKSRQL